jgi:flagellar hook-associated protein FlgK
MGEFWNAWGDLSNNPDGIPEREALLAKSNNLVQFIGELDEMQVLRAALPQFFA